MTVRAKLSDLSIEVRHWRTGNHKTLCPQCSHNRKKRKDPCLSVTIQSDRALVHCFNCDWSTAVFESEYDGRKINGKRHKLGEETRNQRIDIGTARYRQRHSANAT